MENKKGQNVFLGVVAVATLVVAIIGATFAYFSASINGDNEVNLTAYEFDASLVINDLTDEADNKLIPLLVDGPNDETNPTYASGSYSYLLAAVNDTSGEGICVDENGYQVCSLVEAVFTNNGTTPIALTGELTASVNGFTNLKVIELAKDASGKYSVSGTVLNAPAANATPGLSLGTANVNIDGVDTSKTTTKYFAIYLDDIGEQDEEMGQTFTGKLTYTSTVGGNKLTGSFTITE